MVAGLALLGGGCLASGVLAYPFLRQVAEPAAGGLFAAPSYANGVLSRGVTLPVPHVAWSFFSPSGLATSLGTVAAGLVLAWAYMRWPEPRPVAWLRAVAQRLGQRLRHLLHDRWDRDRCRAPYEVTQVMVEKGLADHSSRMAWHDP